MDCDDQRMAPSDWIAFAAVAVSGLAVVFGYLTAKAGVRGQVDVAADERMWQRRADTYVDLLEWCQRMSYIPLDSKEYDNDAIYVPDELMARARAFASPYVANQLAYISGYHAMRMTNHYFEQGKGNPVARANKLVPEFQAMLDMTHQLSQSIREDLASDRAATNRKPERVKPEDAEAGQGTRRGRRAGAAAGAVRARLNARGGAEDSSLHWFYGPRTQGPPIASAHAAVRGRGSVRPCRGQCALRRARSVDRRVRS